MIGCIIQARMGSSRLPDKTMKLIDKKIPMLEQVINQIKFCKEFDKIVVATTTNKEDDQIFDFVKKLEIPCFRGSEKDLLDRYYICAKNFSLKTIIRITSDCPLIDPEITDKIVSEFKSNKYDFTSNTIKRTYPRGLDVEVFSFTALEEAWKNARLPSEREHVTPYIKKSDNQYLCLNIENTNDLSNLRLTVDREGDLKLIRIILSEISTRPILMNDIIKLLKRKPELTEINKKINSEEGYLRSLEEDQNYIDNN